MRLVRAVIAVGLLPLVALGLEPVEDKVAEESDRAERSDAWLRSHDDDAPMVFIEEMNHGFHKLVIAEIQRRKKLALPITTLEDKATFKLVGEVSSKEDIIEREGQRKGFNGARHFAALSMVNTGTGQIVWSCNEDDRNKFDFNSTGRTFRRVAERCVNHLVKAIAGN